MVWLVSDSTWSSSVSTEYSISQSASQPANQSNNQTAKIERGASLVLVSCVIRKEGRGNKFAMFTFAAKMCKKVRVIMLVTAVPERDVVPRERSTEK